MLLPAPAAAYPAAGDRIFPATIILPRAGPVDGIYVTPSTQPVPGGLASNLSDTFDKTITESLWVGIQEGYGRLGRNGASTSEGWQNFVAYLKYEAILDPAHEFLLSVGGAREFGGTGTKRIGALPQGATMPTVFFAKGLGDLDLGYLRPLAVQGFAAYQFSDATPRPDSLVTALAVEYSIPYLQSKVRAFALPELIRGMTPLVEVSVSTPTRNAHGNSTAAIVAPGISYSGEGWEFAIEARLPATRAAGTGAGVTAQLHLSFDYLFPSSIGKPLFSAP